MKHSMLEEASRTLGKPRPIPPKGLVPLLSGYSFPGNVRELKGLIYDAVSQQRERQLSLEPFARVMERARPESVAGAAPSTPHNPFSGFEELPTFSDAAAFLVLEAMKRAGGNQTMAARLLGISQPALSKRLKMIKG